MSLAGSKNKLEGTEKERENFEKRMDELASRISYSFGRRELLRQALTHSTYNSEPHSNYERIEFLGDRVLGLVVSHWLYEALQSDREGDLTKRLAWLVDEEHLVEVGRGLDLPNMVRIGGALSRSRLPPSIIADLVESLIGAIYLDGGIQAATRFILGHIWDSEALEEIPLIASPRNILQEGCARHKENSPSYDCSGHGPDHDKSFVCTASVTIHGKKFEAKGKGRNETGAKVNAAKGLLDMVKEAFGPEWPNRK